MSVKEQANKVIDGIERALGIQYTPEQREKFVEELVGLVKAYPPSSSTDGAARIAAERSRQMKEEGYSTFHDDKHAKGELVLAAISYLWGGWVPTSQIKEMYWPWDLSAYKPKGRIHDLVRAGALIAAEIDRLQRIEAKAKKGDSND